MKHVFLKSRLSDNSAHLILGDEYKLVMITDVFCLLLLGLVIKQEKL